MTGLARVLLLLLACPAWAGQWQKVTAEASLDTRYFPVRSTTSDTRWSFSQQVAVETGWQADDRSRTLDLELFARWDELDEGRREIDLRRFWYSWRFQNIALGAGLQQEFWGVTESRHLVNVLNQIDTVEDVDEEDLLGQPMVKLAYATPMGRFAAYVMPYFRERPRYQPGERLALEFSIRGDGEYESGAEDKHVDVAGRYSWQRGPLDLGLSYFHGTNREPRIRLDQTVAHDRYEQIEQWAMDAQWTTGAWLIKAEALRRADAIETFSAYVLGLEYSFYQVLGQVDLALLVERLKDHRSAPGAPTPYQDDWFGALRIAWNDVYDSSMLVGGYYDREHGETLVRLELERRLTHRWSLDASFTAFLRAERSSAIHPVRRDGFASVKFSYHF